MHEEILNYMIANMCGTTYEEDDPYGVITAVFDLHCTEVTIKARFIGNWDKDDIRYEIVSWSQKSI